MRGASQKGELQMRTIHNDSTNRPRTRSATWRTVLTGFASMLMLATAGSAQAKTINFMAVINGGQEVPATSSNAFGNAFLTLDTQTGALCFAISYDFLSLSSAEIAANFHAPASPGQNAAGVFPLPAGSPKNGCVGPLSSNLQRALVNGRFYINIHTATNLGGEIRGQVIRVQGR